MAASAAVVATILLKENESPQSLRQPPRALGGFVSEHIMRKARTSQRALRCWNVRTYILQTLI